MITPSYVGKYWALIGGDKYCCVPIGLILIYVYRQHIASQKKKRSQVVASLARQKLS